MNNKKDKQSLMVDYNQLAGEYAVHRKVQPLVFEQLIVMGEIAHRSKVLEVGCGTGNYISAIQSVTGCSSWGIDPSSEMLAKASKNTNAVDFQRGCGERIEFPDQFFDMIFSVDVIHHIQDRVSFFREAFRVLKPGGRISTVTESSRMISARKPFSIYFPETVAVDLKRYPTISVLRNTMKFVGFENTRSKAVKFFFLHSDIQDFRDKAYSCLHLISEDGFSQGIERMEQDLKSAPIPWDSQYLLLWGKK